MWLEDRSQRVFDRHSRIRLQVDPHGNGRGNDPTSKGFLALLVVLGECLAALPDWQQWRVRIDCWIRERLRSPDEISGPVDEKSPHFASFVPSPVPIVGPEDQEEGQGHTGVVHKSLTSNIGLGVGEVGRQNLLVQEEHVERNESWSRKSF